MRRAAGTIATTLMVIASAAAFSANAAVAQIDWKPCGSSNEVACGHLTVPLDPSGTLPGTITLAMRRHRAPVGEARDAVIALAGGPGQAALPFVEDFTQILGPIAATRDLIAFDQRGVGLSHPLSCAAFEHSRSFSPALVGICAGQIGETRGLYTTADTVADIEAIRQAGGYEKLVLYGTSYGTRVAEQYAERYPEHVEALVLDSVVPPGGRDPFERTTFEAVPRILRQLCAAGACRHITPEPVRDLARLVRKMRRGPLRGAIVDGDGKAHRVRISSNDLLGVLLAGDFDPILRSEFPAAARAAVDGDTAPLARLLARGSGAEDEEESPSEGFDTPLYYSTVCDETAFPWKTGMTTPGGRLREAATALRAQRAGAFAPFTPANALALSDIPSCAFWPHTQTTPGLGEGTLPDVPTLVLSGADDLRTPTANAEQVAADIPDAQLLVVPNTGHSVLGADPTRCAHSALQALFEDRQVQRCKQRRPPGLFLPTPLPPPSLAAVSPASGGHGREARTLDAAELTLGDFARQIVLATLEQGGIALFGETPDVRVGGLHAGWGGGALSRKLRLHGYSYVPGVTVSGSLSARGARLRISGRAAVHGELRISSRGLITGALGGQRVHLATKRLALTSSEGLELTTSSARLGLAPSGSAARPLAHGGLASGR